MILRDFHTVWLRAVQKIEFLINPPNPISVEKIRFVFHRTIIQYRTKLTGFFVICLQPTYVCLTFENLNFQRCRFKNKNFIFDWGFFLFSKLEPKFLNFVPKFPIFGPKFPNFEPKFSNFEPKFSNFEPKFSKILNQGSALVKILTKFESNFKIKN